MKNLKASLAALLLLVSAPFALGAISEPDRADFPVRNLLTNPGFERFTAGWTASGGATKTANSTAKGTGSAGFDWDSNSAAQTLLSTAVTIPNGMQGKNGVASCAIKVASGAATYTLTANDGTNDIVTAATITNSTTTFARTNVNFAFPASGSVKLKLASVASNEPEIYIDDCYLGLADGYNLSLVNQASVFGTVVWNGATSCTWSTASTSYGDFTADADCTGTRTFTGGLAAPATLIPGATAANLPPGDYEVVGSGIFDSSGAINCRWAISDGTSIGKGENGWDATQATGGTVSGVFSYTAAQSGVTFRIQAKDISGTSACRLTNSSTGHNVTLTVKRFPSAGELAYRPDLINWHVDASIAGANPALGASNVASYTGIEDAGLTLTNNTGNGALTAQIPCSSTNAPTGTTCSVGNESVGVSFNLPAAGDVLACASFGHGINTGSGSLNTTFEIVETPANAQTISQEGKGRLQSGNNIAGVVTHPARVCGTFTFSSAGQKVLRLMYEQAIVTTVTSSTIYADAGASNGQRDIHWEVYPINQAIPAPVLVGSVTSNSAGAERIERASIVNTAGAWSVGSQSGTWISSTTDNGVGDVTLNLTAGIFSGTPSCTCVANASAGFRGCQIGNGTATSTSAVRASIYTDAGSASDLSFDIHCMGPR